MMDVHHGALLRERNARVCLIVLSSLIEPRCPAAIELLSHRESVPPQRASQSTAYATYSACQDGRGSGSYMIQEFWLQAPDDHP
jgi:hypothetical protein